MTPVFQQDTMEKILAMVQSLASEPSLDDAQELNAQLATLRAYECWQPYLKLLWAKMQAAKTIKLEDYVAYIQALYWHEQDPQQALEVCKKLIKELPLGFQSFELKVLAHIVAPSEVGKEAQILAAVADQFTELSDRIACLERLCVLYEKRLHLSTALNETFHRLLRLDPHNVKALRYLKASLIQAAAWDEVSEVLERLLHVVKHQEEAYRVAQELAAVWLYQRQQPQKAIEILETYCQKSPLDSSAIHYDAYASLHDWRGCLRVLERCQVGVQEPWSQAVLHYRMAQLYLQLEEDEPACQHFEQAGQLGSIFLEAYEQLVYLAIKRKDWPALGRHLQIFSQRLQDEALKRQMTALLASWEGCLKG